MTTNDSFIKYSSNLSPIQGDGSLENPYQIAHPLHFREMRENLSSHFILVQNLDLGENKNFGPIGSWQDPFEGTFDGAEKTIRNLKIRRPDKYGVGLFGYAQEGSVIRNVKLEKIDIVGKQWVGGLVGSNVHKEITEVYFDAKAKSDAGEEEAWKEYDAIFEKRNRYGGKIEASYATGKVEGEEKVGGLVGWNDGTIEASCATGKVEGEEKVGGLVGENYKGTIKTSYATGKVEGKGNVVGGLVGLNDGTIKTSCATGKVEGEEKVGGLVGWNYKGTIKTSYATGKVEGGGNVGGLVGWNYVGTIEASYATGEVNGKEWVGGLVGSSYYGKIKMSYSTGKVEGKKDVGGLVGSNYGKIKMSYSTGKVEGKKDVGGLVGWNFTGTIQTSYAAGKVEGEGNVGGFVGANDKDGRIEGKNYWWTGSAKEGVGKNNGKISHIEGKSKFEMILKELEWDLEVWEFPPGKHPRLRWQSSSQ